jgi:hypothetical protein
MIEPNRLEELKADARYHRERRDLYRAKMHGPRPTSPVRLRELDRACALSESRLRRAEQEPEIPGSTAGPVQALSKGVTPRSR